MKRPAAACLALALLFLATLARADDKDDKPADSSKSDKTEKVEKTESTKPAAKPGTLAIFRFSGAITDRPMPDDPLFGTIGGESLNSLVTRLNKAAKDKDVAAVVMVFDSASLGYGQVEEIRAAVARVREAGKPVYAHADSVDTGSYLLLCGASRLSISPTGDVWVTGLYGEQPFLRGLLDMLQVEPDFLTCGTHKSAAEMFMRTEPSPESKEMYGWIYDSMLDSMVKSIAKGRGVDEEKALKWINAGMYSAEKAREAGLIDAVETREALTDALKKEHGSAVKFDRSYGKQSGLNIDLNNPFAVMQLYAQILAGPQVRKSTKDAVAVVHIDGAIMLGKEQPSLLGESEGAYSEPIRKALDEIADDPRVKAVVLRVNSPGGSATASEIMLQAITRVKDRKPVVVSMGDVAASGGYYVSCKGDKIFADATTLTGSIGVVGGKLATARMWGRIGINFSPIQRGERAGVLSGAHKFTDDERTTMQAWMDEIYAVFKGHVTEGRGEKLAKPLDDIAGGRVYTGAQAKELGLVDEIGTLQDAIAFAVEKSGLSEKDYEVRTVPRSVNILETLFEDIAPQKKDDPRLSLSLWDAALPLLSGVDPQRVRLVQQALGQLDMLHKEQVILSMPVIGFPSAK